MFLRLLHRLLDMHMERTDPTTVFVLHFFSIFLYIFQNFMNTYQTLQRHQGALSGSEEKLCTLVRNDKHIKNATSSGHSDKQLQQNNWTDRIDRKGC